MTRSKDIGTATETSVVRWLNGNGWPLAERRALHGEYDMGDITGTPGVVWEVKGGKAAEGASDGQVSLWLAETEVERYNAHADYGLLVIKRKGIGPIQAGKWWAVMSVGEFIHLCDPGPFRPKLGTLDELPVRLHLSTATMLLRRLGYGDPL